MVVKQFTYPSCPNCGRNITGLYGRFVEPSNPVKDCPHCGNSVVKEATRLGLLIRKYDGLR